MRQFTTAARRGAAAVRNPVDVTFEFEVREGEFVEMTAHAPTTGQLALFMAHQLDAGSGAVRAMFNLLSAVLDPRDYRIVEQQLHEGLDVVVVTEVVQYLIEEWSARPTLPPSDSATSPPTTGSRSTGKPLAVVSNSSTSRSTDS